MGLGSRKMNGQFIWQQTPSLNKLVITPITALSSGIYTRIIDAGIPIKQYDLNYKKQTVNKKKSMKWKLLIIMLYV